MMLSFRVLALLGLFATVSAYISCKEIAETEANPVSQVYPLDINGQQLNVFCEFRPNNLGYTYLQPVNNLDFNTIVNNLLPGLTNDNSDVVLKFITAQGQFESIISPLSIYSTFKFVKQFSNLYSPPFDAAPYLYLGILPKAKIAAPGIPNGYQVNGVDRFQYTCNALGNSYILLDPKPGATANLMTPTTRPWYTNGIGASAFLPWTFFFKWTESQNCITYEEGWGLNIGFKFTYDPPCVTPIAGYVGNYCQRIGGQCMKTICPQNFCPTGFITGYCSPFEPDYLCCLPYVPPYAECKFYGDPHINTFDGTFYDNHVPGWYYASRDCSWSWYVRAYFYHPSGAFWTIMSIMEFNVGGKILTVYNNGIVFFDGAQLFGPYNVLTVFGNVITLYLPNPFVSNILIQTNFGVEIEVTPLPYTQLIIRLQSLWLTRTCGLCGPWDLDSTNDRIYEFTSGARLDKRQLEEPEEEAVLNRNERAVNCSGTNLTDAENYCQNQLDTDSGNCGQVPADEYKGNCVFDYCLGGEDAANYSLNSFRSDCYPPKLATCSMCGFREIITFDGAPYYYLGSECEYEFAKDCRADGDFSVVVVLKEQKLGGTNELLLSRVKITYKGKKIVFIRSGHNVKVEGDDVTTAYISPDSDFIITFTGHLVTFKSPALIVSYNFKQMLKVSVSEKYYDETCGLCGYWNDDPADDSTDGDSSQLANDCDAGVVSTPCSDAADQAAAEDLCRASLEEIACNEINIDDFVQRCAYEFCQDGYKMLCQHLLEVLDKCFWLTGDGSLLTVIPDACDACPPPNPGKSGNGGSDGNGEPQPAKPLNDCEKAGGVCLEERCEHCANDEWLAEECPTPNKRCCKLQ